MRLFWLKRDEPDPISEAPTVAPSAPVVARTPEEPAGPSWMSAPDWSGRLTSYRSQGRSDEEIRGIAEHLEKRGPRAPRQGPQGRKIATDSRGRVAGSGVEGMVLRADYVAKEDEARYVARDEHGLLTLRLVDAGDRLAFWSPLDGGKLLNPKGPGLRSVGLFTTGARGAAYYASTYRTADLRKGRPVELRREPGNAHDPNAIALHAPGAPKPFAYVQRGRASSPAKRIDRGEDLAGLCMWGPGPGQDNGTAFLVVASRADLATLAGSG